MNLLLAKRISDLERRVTLLEARSTVLRDPTNCVVLELLKRFDASPFNKGVLSMTPETMQHGTGLDSKDLALALNALQHAAFIELVSVDSTGHWRITDDGRAAL